jgi:hypothetical protein
MMIELKEINIGFEVLPKSSIFWDITPSSNEHQPKFLRNIS